MLWKWEEKYENFSITLPHFLVPTVFYAQKSFIVVLAKVFITYMSWKSFVSDGRSQYVQSNPRHRPIFVSSKKIGIEGNFATFQGASWAIEARSVDWKTNWSDWWTVWWELSLRKVENKIFPASNRQKEGTNGREFELSLDRLTLQARLH